VWSSNASISRSVVSSIVICLFACSRQQQQQQEASRSVGWLHLSHSLSPSRERETDHRARSLEDLPGLTRDISIAESDDVMATATVDATAPGVGAAGVAAAAPSIQVVRLMVANGNTDETSTVVIDTASSSIDGSTPVRINPELALSCVVQYRTETPLQGIYPSLTRLVALTPLLLTNRGVGWLVGWLVYRA